MTGSFVPRRSRARNNGLCKWFVCDVFSVVDDVCQLFLFLSGKYVSSVFDHVNAEFPRKRAYVFPQSGEVWLVEPSRR